MKLMSCEASYRLILNVVNFEQTHNRKWGTLLILTLTEAPSYAPHRAGHFLEEHSVDAPKRSPRSPLPRMREANDMA